MCGFSQDQQGDCLDLYSIPLVTDIMDRVADCQYLSKLDLNKGFHQVPLAEDVQMKTAIVTPFGKFQFMTMPFGLVMLLLLFNDLWMRF